MNQTSPTLTTAQAPTPSQDESLPQPQEFAHAVAVTPTTTVRSHGSAGDPTVLRCVGAADFLAALPWLTGLALEPGLFVVLFRGSRASQALRFALPNSAEDAAIEALLDSVDTLLDHAGREATAPALVIVTDEAFPVAEAGTSPSLWRALAAAITRRTALGKRALREFAVVASDGWATLMGRAAYTRQPLSLIAARSHALATTLPTAAPRSLAELACLPTRVEDYAEAISQQLMLIADDELSSDATDAFIERGANGEIRTHDDSWAHCVAHVAESCFIEASDNVPDDELWHPRLAARLVRATQSRAGWLVCAFTALVRASFVATLVEQHGVESTFSHPSQSRLVRIFRALASEPTDQMRLKHAALALRRITAQAPPDMQPNLLALLAWAWWHAGMQSLAEHYAREALQRDPLNFFGKLVTTLNEAPPQWQLDRLAATT